MSVPNTQNSVMGVTVRGANARRIVNSTASAGRTVGKPALFQVRVTPDGQDTVSVDVWLVPDIAEAVRRNGWPVAPQGAYVVTEPGWVSVASGIAVSDTPKFVVLRCKWDYSTLSKPSGWTGDLYWTIGIETLTGPRNAWYDRLETPVVLGVIVGGVAHQLHVGAAETWCTLVDSEVDLPSYYKSLGWRGDLPSDTAGHFQELWQFCQMDHIAAIDLSAVYSGSADSDHDLNILIRTWDTLTNTARLDYSTLDGLLDEYAKDEPTTGEFVEWLESIIHDHPGVGCAYKNSTGHDCPFLGIPPFSGPLALVWDSDTETWTFDETSGKWWEQGGGAATCYGSAIGDSNKTKVLDLDAKELVGAWAVNAAGSLTIPAGGLTFEGRTVVARQVETFSGNVEILELV